MISTGDMKRGATIELDGRVYQVMEFDAHQDGPRLARRCA